MDAIADNTTARYSQSREKNWADYLLIAGLIIYAFASTFSIAASQIGLGLALIAFVALYRDGKASFKPTSFSGPYAFLVLTAIMAVFRAEYHVRALVEVKSFLVIFSFYLVYWPDTLSDQRTRILNIYLFSAALIAAFSCAHSYIFMRLGDHAQGFFSTSITFGECQALATLALIHKLVNSRHSPGTKLMWLLALTVTMTSLILSFTRGAWMGFAAGFAVLFVGFPRRLLPIVAVSILSFAIALHFSPYMRERISGFDVSKILTTADKSFNQNFESIAIMSSFHRLYIWQRGFTMLKDNHAFGIGAKNMKYHYYRLSTDYERENNLVWSHQHNNFMQMLLSYGFIGLIAFLYFIISLVKFTMTGTGNAQYGALAIFVCFLTFGLTEHSWGDEEVIMMTFFLTGLMICSTEEKASQG
ncbi:MAG: O-antigen ligase family protein [Candidatus Riflebacteria bacterium]|nr:O-antigen ligase family protein [Candidatus Riflebacteria bacterium]